MFQAIISLIIIELIICTVSVIVLGIMYIGVSIIAWIIEVILDVIEEVIYRIK